MLKIITVMSNTIIFFPTVLQVSVHPVREALKVDGSNVTLQAMPGITTRHVQPNNFEKMRVTYAFQLFGDTVLNGLRLYQSDIEARCGSIEAVLIFFGYDEKYLLWSLD